jgi:lipopolysaccharide/colanic/teichoic acid biosynthesis glycosyltransferase
MNLRIFAPLSLGVKQKPVALSDVYIPLEVTGSAVGVSDPGVAYRIMQRSLDIVLSIAALLILLVPCLIVAALIKLETPGPVLFKQKRVGKSGNQFWFYKFRSMVADAESQRNALIQLNEATGPLFKIKNDPRITRIGRFIRKYSIDELPQFLNVLVGQMSLVGPRPALPAEVAQYNARQRMRLSVLPGITGLWQVSGRSDLPFDRSIELDLEYIQRQSMSFYFWILLMTVPAVVKGRGAY